MAPTYPYTQSLQQPYGTNILEKMFGTFGQGNSGYVEGQGGLDYLNLFAGDVPILGDILGLYSRQQTAKKAQQAQDETNRANEARYQQVLGLQNERRNLANQQLNQTGQYLADSANRTLGDISGIGAASRRGILDREQQSLAANDSGLRNRGLFNTTIGNSNRRAINSDTNRDLGALDERIAGLRSQARQSVEGRLADFMRGRTAYENQLTGDLSGAIERKTEMANNNVLLPMLLQQRGGSSEKKSSGLGGLLGGVIGGLF